MIMPRRLPVDPATKCTVPGCPTRRARVADGLCDTHHYRAERYGDPEVGSRYDVDEIAVERAAMGDPPERLTTAERELVVRRLHAWGMSDPQIARHLDVGPDAVFRIRRRLGLPAVACPAA